MDFSIRHDIPGRLRIHALYLSGAKKGKTLADKLHDTPGILRVRLNPRCASLVISYHPELIDKTALTDLLQTLFPSAAEPASGPACGPNTAEISGKRDPMRKAGIRFGAISLVTGAAFVRNNLLGKALGQTLFSPLGLLALAFTLPLIRSGLAQFREKRLGLDGFLAGGSVASVAAGQAMTSLEILWINSGAELLSAWIAERSRKSIASILEITSHHTFVLVEGVEVERAVDDLAPGDIVVLHTGEKVCVDGEILSGEALLNEAPISGREEPVHKKGGDRVHAGTFVISGVIHVRAECVGDGTYLARIMQKVTNELENRAPIELEADRLAARLVKIGLGATAFAFLATGSAWRAFTVLLVMACPCATALAASTAVSAAISAAAKRQILIKGGRYLEEVGKCEHVFFDKTGTLTTSAPALQEIITLPGVDEEELIRLACSAETHNHHPLAQAILTEAEKRGIAPIPHEVCDYHLGMGMHAVINGKKIYVGNARLMRLFGLDTSSISQEVTRMQAQGLTVIHIFCDENPQGLMGFAAEIRPEAADVILRLRKLGVRNFSLITGDEETSARLLAEKLGIEAWHAGLMPEEKAEIIARFAGKNSRTMVVGDGINDALALTRADVGVAMGTAGSEVAVEAADIALATENLEALSDLYALSKKTVRIARENFWIATGVNLLGVVLALAGRMTPVGAGLFHIGHSVGVGLNSMRLLADKKKKPKGSLNAPSDMEAEAENAR